MGLLSNDVLQPLYYFMKYNRKEVCFLHTRDNYEKTNFIVDVCTICFYNVFLYAAY